MCTIGLSALVVVDCSFALSVFQLKTAMSMCSPKISMQLHAGQRHGFWNLLIWEVR